MNKINFNKFPPYIWTEVDEIDGEVQGRKNFFFVRVKKGDWNQSTLKHEEAHVIIWWCLFILSVALLSLFGVHWGIALFVGAFIDRALSTFSKSYETHKEAFCYAYGWAKSRPLYKFNYFLRYTNKMVKHKFNQNFEKLLRKYMTKLS